MKIKESELKAILEEVAADLSKCFEEEKEKLVKAFPEGSPEKSSEGSSSSDESSKPALPEGSPEGSSSSSEGSSSSDEGSKADGSVPPPPPAASPSPAASPAAPVAPPVADPAAAPAADAAPVTPEVLHAEYLRLMQEDPAQFAMHVQALDAVKAATAGASPSPSPAPAAPAAPPDAMKAELSPSPERVGGPHVEVVHKSEDVSRFESVMKSYELKVAELEAKLKSQAEEQVAVQQVLTRIVERPMRKSVESMTQVAAPAKKVDLAKMTKEAVSKHLSNVARTNLKKSDRSLINEFYTGTAKLEQLAHLFEEVK